MTSGLNPTNKTGQQHISNDFVPATMTKGHGSLADSEKELAKLIDLQNDTFGALGVTTSYGKKQQQGNKKTDMCGNCSREIVGKVIFALDQTWHPACFQCSQCAKPIEMVGTGGSYIVRNNKAWCNKCDQWDKKENKGKKPAGAAPGGTAGSGGDSSGHSGASNDVASKNAEIARKNQDQLDAHANIQMGKELCAACNRAIMGEAVDYNRGTVQQFFHVACFVCAQCKQPISDTAQGFQHYKQKIYHPACYKAMIGHGPCGGCGQNIVTKYVQPDANGPKFHSQCFVCCMSDCKKPLASGFAMREGKAYCGDCANKKFSTNTRVDTERVAGFKIDPMTHQKVGVGMHTAAGANPAPKTTVTVTSGAAPSGAAGAKAKFCPQCGKPLTGGNFCGQCGAKVN